MLFNVFPVAVPTLILYELIIAFNRSKPSTSLRKASLQSAFNTPSGSKLLVFTSSVFSGFQVLGYFLHCITSENGSNDHVADGCSSRRHRRRRRLPHTQSIRRQTIKEKVQRTVSAIENKLLIFDSRVSHLSSISRISRSPISVLIAGLIYGSYIYFVSFVVPMDFVSFHLIITFHRFTIAFFLYHGVLFRQFLIVPFYQSVSFHVILTC